MAANKSKKAKSKEKPFEKAESHGKPGETLDEALPVSEATDGGEPSIREEIRDVPDERKPDPSTIAQEEVLSEPAGDEEE